MPRNLETDPGQPVELPALGRPVPGNRPERGRRNHGAADGADQKGRRVTKDQEGGGRTLPSLPRGCCILRDGNWRVRRKPCGGRNAWMLKSRHELQSCGPPRRQLYGYLRKEPRKRKTYPDHRSRRLCAGDAEENDPQIAKKILEAGFNVMLEKARRRQPFKE